MTLFQQSVINEYLKRQATKIKDEINQKVYKLYDLTDEEIKLVEGKQIA